MEGTAVRSTEPGVSAIDPSAPGAKGLKSNALGYASNLVISVASTAPAYSLAATLGFVTAVTGMGIHSPAVLIVAFIPILFVSVAYRYFNLADPDAGTTFAWTTRAFGPRSPPCTNHHTPPAVRTAMATARMMGRRGVADAPGSPGYWTVAVPVMFGWTEQTNAYVPAARAGTW